MVKTYIRAPNWTTAPPPHGPLKLGHLLPNLEEFRPINADDDILPITNENPVHTERKVHLKLHQVDKDEVGIFAKFLMQAAAGLKISFSRDDNASVDLYFESFDTMSFNPPDKYLEDTMKLDVNMSYIQEHKYKKPLYLVTGLKIGRTGSGSSAESSTSGANLEAGVNIPEVPIELGPRVVHSRSTETSFSHGGANDHIVAFQVRKLWYKKDRLAHEMYKKNAELHGNKQTPNQAPEIPLILAASDDVSATDFRHCLKVWHEVDTDDNAWVVPLYSSTN